ncbi:hypothetical protein EJ08DRAFT_739508 [Tothia fuscella]|uniref:Protein kinase domain-containing protein n=1 Tax=Tothia fuscella TaxID=1048955 RepID=A0A9P4NE53_9PEZI|nr:hypothetical protein EJ08DRAFT_739508 [Tothia fuscella]
MEAENLKDEETTPDAGALVSRLQSMQMTLPSYNGANYRALVLTEESNILEAKNTMNIAAPEAYHNKLFAVQQTTEDVRFAIEGFCYVYYSPYSNDLAIVNTTRYPLQISEVTQDLPNIVPQQLLPTQRFLLTSSALWSITNNSGARVAICTGVKRHFTIQQPSIQPPIFPVKRTIDDISSEDLPAENALTKRIRGRDGLPVDTVLKAHTIAQSIEVDNSNTTLISLKEGETFVNPHPDGYEITKIKDLVPSSARHPNVVFVASYSAIDGQVIVKLLSKPSTTADVTVAGAENWQHEKVAVDATFHALFFEYVISRDLSHFCTTDLNYRFAGGSLRDAAQIVFDVADTLHHMHTNNIFHNDLKCANILITDSEGEVQGEMEGEIAGDRPRLANEISLEARLTTSPRENYTGGMRGPEKDIFALGIVTLFLAGYIQCPEKSVRAWKIAAGARGDQDATTKMMAWASYLAKTRERARANLDGEPLADGGVGKAVTDHIEKILLESAFVMTNPLPGQRPTAKRVREMFSGVVGVGVGVRGGERG